MSIASRSSRHVGGRAHAARDIDTDQIIPARFLKTVDRDGLGEQLFCDWRYLPTGRPIPTSSSTGPRWPARSVLLAGDNFGCGCSREHAPWALLAWGFRAVISSSFADIFRNNALKNGLLPIEVPPEELSRLFDLVDADPDARSRSTSRRRRWGWRTARKSASGWNSFARRMILDGTDELGYLLCLEPQLAAYEAAHPPRSTLA